MSGAGIAAGLQAAPVGRASADYAVAVSHDWDAARLAWEAALRHGAATPFQSVAVVEAWYRAMAARPDLEPVIATVAEAATGAHALSLALVRARFGARRTIAFADLGLVDYNAPVLGPAAPLAAEGARRLWRDVLRALPRADLVDLRKMPVEVEGRPNPLALIATLPSALNGNVVATGEDWGAYHHGLKRAVRKELERSWRVFTRHPGAAFRSITDAAERRRVLAAIERQQPLRMEATGKTYSLDAPEAAAFYRGLVAAGPETVVLTALVAGEEIVGALLGLRDRDTYVMVRISNAEGAWASASPGRVVIDQSMAWLHGAGVRRFDFSIGNYDYKRRFGVEPLPLVDLVRPLGWRGLPAFAEARARAWLRARPLLAARVRRLRPSA